MSQSVSLPFIFAGRCSFWSALTQHVESSYSQTLDWTRSSSGSSTFTPTDCSIRVDEKTCWQPAEHKHFISSHQFLLEFQWLLPLGNIFTHITSMITIIMYYILYSYYYHFILNWTNYRSSQKYTNWLYGFMWFQDTTLSSHCHSYSSSCLPGCQVDVSQTHRQQVREAEAAGRQRLLQQQTQQDVTWRATHQTCERQKEKVLVYGQPPKTGTYISHNASGQCYNSGFLSNIWSLT